jgi:hypothetical protein
MNRTGIVLSAAVILLFLTGAAGAASAATPGSVTYSVSISSGGSSFAMTVNETVATTSNPAHDNLILKVAEGGSTLNYSRSVNSSDVISPFLPAITNQSFSSTTGSRSITASITKNGSETIQFQGASYTLTSYSISGVVTLNASTVDVQGALTTFPSGLIDSASLHLSFTGLNASSVLPSGIFAPSSTIPTSGTIRVSLLSTNLPLDSGTSSPAAQAASIGIGAGAAVSALAIGLGVRRHNKHSDAAPETKPEHWVD